jgi:hypothetical protein
MRPPDGRIAGLFGGIQVERGNFAKAECRLEPGIVHVRHIVVLRVVYGCKFGAASRAGRVNGCEIVKEPRLRLFTGAGTGVARQNH